MNIEIIDFISPQQCLGTDVTGDFILSQLSLQAHKLRLGLGMLGRDGLCCV